MRDAPTILKPMGNSAWLSRAVAQFLVSEATAKAPLETGGVLLGYSAHPGSVPVILWASGPGPRAIHLRDYYRPDQRFDEAQIAEAYEQSGRRLSYLGDWHTHVPPFPFLSERDKRTLRRIARCRSARVQSPVMLILTFDQAWHPVVWQGTLTKGSIWGAQLRVHELAVRVFSGRSSFSA